MPESDTQAPQEDPAQLWLFDAEEEEVELIEPFD